LLEGARLWVRRAEADAGARGDLMTTSERERLKALERENRELRKANEILKAASVCFAKELDPPPTEVSAFVDERRSDFGVELICRTHGRVGVRLLRAPKR
jgi:hypothetical protein